MFVGLTSAVNYHTRCKAIRYVHVIYIFLMVRLILEQNLCAIAGPLLFKCELSTNFECI